MKPFLRVENSVARLGDLLQLGNFSKPVVTIILPKSSTLLCNFCKGVKIFHFSSKFILGNCYRHLTTFYWSHWLKMARSREQFLSPSLTSTIGTTFSTLKPIWNVPAKRDQNRWSLKSKRHVWNLFDFFKFFIILPPWVKSIKIWRKNLPIFNKKKRS